MIRRREFIAGLGSAAAWPVVGWAQEPVLPVLGFIDGGSADVPAGSVVAFRKGLNDTGFFEGQNVTVEYRWLEGKYDQLPALTAALVHNQSPAEGRPSAPQGASAQITVESAGVVAEIAEKHAMCILPAGAGMLMIEAQSISRGPATATID